MVLLIHQGKLVAMVVKDPRLSFFLWNPCSHRPQLAFSYLLRLVYQCSEYVLTHLQLPAFELDSRDFHQIRARSLHYGLKKEPESKFADNWQKQISVSHKKSPIHICCTFSVKQGQLASSWNLRLLILLRKYLWTSYLGEIFGKVQFVPSFHLMCTDIEKEIATTQCALSCLVSQSVMLLPNQSISYMDL